MNINRLRYFSAVVETCNLRKAAEMVSIAPPSMSKAISVLEHEVGIKLIYSEGRGIGITDEGLNFYRKSLGLLQEYKKFEYSLNASNESEDFLSIATFEVFSSYFLSRFFFNEKKYKPLVLEMVPGQIENAIIKGTVQVGISYIPSPSNKLDYLEIGSFNMSVYGLKKWQSISFANWPFAIPTTELKIHSSEIESLDMWPKGPVKRYIKYKFELLETALQTTSLGDSVIHCPDFVVKFYNAKVKSAFQLVDLKYPKKIKKCKPIKIYLITKKGMAPRFLEGKLAKFVRNIKKLNSESNVQVKP